MPKCRLKNGNIYPFTTEEYNSIKSSGIIFIEKVEDDKKPDVLKDKVATKDVVQE